MRRSWFLIIAAMMVMLTPRPLWSSGPDWAIALFGSPLHPDPPFDRFVAGNLGVILPSWRVAHRYVAYRYLAGRGFNPTEQRVLISYWNRVLGVDQSPAQISGWSRGFRTADQNTGVSIDDPQHEWLAARTKVPGIVILDKIEVFHPGPDTFQTFLNCDSDAFHTASATLTTMVAAFGASSEQVKRWLDAQDQVFANCSGAQPPYTQLPYFFGPHTEPAAPSAQRNFSPGQTTVNTAGPESGNTKSEVEYSSSPCFGSVGSSKTLLLSIAGCEAAGAAAGTPSKAESPREEWTAARKDVGSPAGDFSESCSDSTYRAATRELKTMVKEFGPSSPQVKQWTDAQDSILLSCGSSPNVGTQAVSLIPDPLEKGTRLERAQRSYQIACANFYSENFDQAAELFQAIAADASSPWQSMAPYLIARTTIRKATLSGEKNDLALLTEAAGQLNKVVQGSGDERAKRAAQHLLGFITYRAAWRQSENEIAGRLAQAESGDTFQQDLQDYFFLFYNGATLDVTQEKEPSQPDDLTDWLSTFNDPRADLDHSAERWNKTGTLPWLVASLSAATASDAVTSALLKAAEMVKPDSPAFPTLNFQIARLLIEQGNYDQARSRLETTLGAHDRLPLSSVNQFKALRMRVARNLEELLTYAQRVPLGITDTADDEQLPQKQDDPALTSPEPLFDVDAVELFNQRLPLAILERAARGRALAPKLRGRVALATWTRAVLLGNEQTARELSPLVVNSEPSLKPPMNEWLAEKDTRARSFDVAFMMLRNPGMRFEVDAGLGREEPIGKWGIFRDNWWPSQSYQPAFDGSLPPAGYPIFMSVAERGSAENEWKALSALNAPNFLCGNTIGWARNHPEDARVAQALSLCVKAVRLGRSNCESSKLAKAAFTLLHRQYAGSSWVTATPYWYPGSCTTKTIPDKR